MNQQTFSDIEYSNRRRSTRRESFLNEMDRLIPWDRWIAMISPYYPEGRRGRPPKDKETMLRMYLIRLWYNLSDEGTEDVIYDSYAMRRFMHLDFLDEQVPAATTLIRFRHLIDGKGIGDKIREEMRNLLAQSGKTLRTGSIQDARTVSLPAQAGSADNRKEELS